VHAPTGEPCNQCEQCRRITMGNHVDVVEIDGASNRGIDDARRLREAIAYAPMEGRYKVFIIDEAHMLTRESFNALLKTLEEPPPRATFILATTEAHKFPITIVSRCQHFIFKAIPEAELVAHLTRVLNKEGIPFEENAVRLLARRAAGSVRDSMSLLGQTLALGGDNLTEASTRSVLGLAGQELYERLLNALKAQDCLAVAALTQELLERGVDLGFFLRELTTLWRNLFLIRQAGAAATAALDMPDAEKQRLLDLAPQFDPAYIHAAWQMVLESQRQVLTSLEPSAALELLLCEDPEEAEAIVAGLEAQNAARQKAEQDILQGVLDSVAADETYGADRILVVWGRGYHQGVIGIVASRVVERFGKPAIIVSVDENGEGKGSGRSIAGVSLYNAIAACGDLLIRFGGHALAAGLSVREENLPAFRKAVNAWAAQEHPVLKRPALRLDAPLALSGLKEEDVAALSVLAPFGHGNPTPVFFVENAVIDAVYPLSEGKHTRLRLKQGGGVLYAAVFGQGPGALGYNVGDAVDAAVCLSVFEGKNGPMISARIKELRPAGLDEAYLEGTELYEALMCGAPLTESQRRALLPARADTVALYRAVGAARDGVPAGDLRPLFAKLGARGAGKALVSLEALRELSLLEQRETPQGARWCLVPAAGKKDLASAPILRRLEAAQ